MHQYSGQNRPIRPKHEDPMAAKQPIYSPRQIAEALGVSESSVKRWCDSGAIETIRTVGGHRRITLDGLRRYVQSSDHRVIVPEILGLQASPMAGDSNHEAGSAVPDLSGSGSPSRDAFRRALVTGDLDLCRRLLQEEIAVRRSRFRAMEAFSTDAMGAIGEAWVEKRLDPYLERRATRTMLRLIDEAVMEVGVTNDSAPVAIGGTLEGDHYEIASSLIELALLENGWRATNLGPNLPVDSFRAAVHEYRPKLLWLSVNDADTLRRHRESINELHRDISGDTALVIGGQALTDELRSEIEFTAHCDSLKHLIELTNLMRFG